MYVRETRIRRGDKVYTYYQVVRGYRVDGRVRQEVVAHIGPAEGRKQATRRARVMGILCGVDGCGEGATEILEHNGYCPTWSHEGVEYPFVVCPTHLASWRDGERIWSAYPCVTHLRS
jgi:hypothetical protein